MSTPADPPALAAALTRVPDVPHWVDTRGMLESGRAEVWFAPSADTARDGFVVTMPDRALASVVGAAPATLIDAVIGRLSGDVNVTCRSLIRCLPCLRGGEPSFCVAADAFRRAPKNWWHPGAYLVPGAVCARSGATARP